MTSSGRRRKDTRAADGDGALYFDAKRELWIGELMVGWKADAKDPKTRRRDVRKVSARKQADCRAKLQRLRHEHGAGTLPEKSGRDTLGAFLERWLDAKKGTVRDRTHERYGQLLRCHVIPTLGATRLPALRAEALGKLYGEKMAAGLSARTVHHVHTVLHGAIADAMKWQHVGRNVAELVDPPSVPTVETRWPSSDEVGQLLAASAAHNDRMWALWVLAAHTGMRLGELLALTWDDVNLEVGVLMVNRILVKVVGQVPTFGEPKTKRSRRPVPMTPAAVAGLRHHHKRQAEERLAVGGEYGTHKLIFATVTGTPLSGAVALKYFRRALGWANLPAEIRIHDLRHAAASTMLGSGVDIPSVARVLGHARNSTTLDVYGHAVPGNLMTAVATIERAIGGA
ncbi:MAG: tyrosine-type recombinase/integrase [Chloroflexota bacterium]